MTQALVRKPCAIEKTYIYQYLRWWTPVRRTVAARQDAPAAANLAGLAGMRSAP
jgi:hypothetical protein